MSQVVIAPDKSIIMSAQRGELRRLSQSREAPPRGSRITS